MKELMKLFVEKVGRYPRGNVQDELRSWAANEITTLRQQLAKSEARVTKYEALIRELRQQSRRVRNYSNPDDLFDAVPVRALMAELDNGPHGLKEHLEWQAQWLRQQADEAERAGGE